MGLPKTTHSIELRDAQYAYLQKMVDKYQLPDVDKAIRVMIDHARSEPDLEEDIFEKMRCVDC